MEVNDEEVSQVQDEIEEAIATRVKMAVDHLLSTNITEDRITHGPLDIDHDVVYVSVDGMPVYRAVVAYDDDSVNLFGSWLYGNLDKLSAN